MPILTQKMQTHVGPGKKYNVTHAPSLFFECQSLPLRTCHPYTDCRNAGLRENTSERELRQSISVVHGNGTHFLCLLCLHGLGGCGCCLCCLLHLTKGLERDLRGCDCHSRLASLNQTKQVVQCLVHKMLRIQ